MLDPEGYLERGDGPAKAVLRANAEQQAIRRAMETREELEKIRNRVCVTLSAYEIGEELQQESQNNVEQIKSAFVKDDAELEFVDDMAQLYLILSDPIAKRKLLSQLQEFFNQSAEDDHAFQVDTPELDLDDVGRNVSDALNKAEKTTERLANISKEVLKVFDLVNPKDHKKGKKKLEKALYQSHQDVMTLTEKLVGVQSDLEDARSKLISLNKQVELKDLDIERLKLQVNTSKAFAKECDDLKKALEAKEKQLQNYRVEVDETELALSQAENKCDNYAENYRKLKEEKEKLVEDMERQSKEQQQKIIDTRKELELKYDQQVSELKRHHEQLTTELKQSQEEEFKNLRENIDLIRKSSPSKTESTLGTPSSRDSAVKRFSGVASKYSQSLSWKSSAKLVKTITNLKGSVGSRLDTATSQVSMSEEKDSVLETSGTLPLSMSSTPTPSTPKTAETQGNDVVQRSRDRSSTKKSETFTQTDDIKEPMDLANDSEVKSKNDLQEIEVDLSKTPLDELPQKVEEYKNKSMEVQQQLQEEVMQWKLKYNAKAQALIQLVLTQEKEMKEKEDLMIQLSAAQELQAKAEEEAEEAILQLEELRAKMETNDIGDFIAPDKVATENKSTLTSASLLRKKNEDQVKMQDRLQYHGDLHVHQSVGIQCPSTHALRKPSLVSLQYSESELPMADEEDGADGIPKIDSGFGGSEQILPSKLEEEINKTSPKLVVKNTVKGKNECSKPRTSASPSPRVRSRLIRSALKDHRVVDETIKTYEMISEFKMNMIYWLKQHGLEDKSELLTAIPDVCLDKTDELDVLDKMPLIRDHAQQILGALWQVTVDNHSWQDQADGLVQDYRGNGVNEDENFSEDHPFPTPKKEVQGIHEGNVITEADTILEERAQSVQTDSLFLRSPRTTPRGYTHLLHEYNNLNEAYSKLQQQLETEVKSYQEQTSQNVLVMNEMQETINNLTWQLLETSSTGRCTGQPLSSSVMFTRLDAERNVTSMKRAVHSNRLSQASFNNAVMQMNQYVDLPRRRLVELVWRYRHHCAMKEVEENLYPPKVTRHKVYNLQERMERLQRLRAEKWSEKMAEMSRRRSVLSDEITTTLNEIENSSGIFLIKPVYSYSSRPQQFEKLVYPIICKKRLESQKKLSFAPSDNGKKPVYPQERSSVTVFHLKQDSDRAMWISEDSHVSGKSSSYENIPIPRLLAMDVNRIMLNRNPVSESVNPKSINNHSVPGVRQYVTVERPTGVMPSTQLDGEPEVTSRHSLPDDSRSSSPSLSHYPTLPPINLPNIPSQHNSSVTSGYTNQSVSSLSLTSSDETFS